MHKKKKVKMSEKKRDDILQSALFIGTVAELVSIAFQHRMIDNKFNQPILNLHAKHIREGAQAIHKELGKTVYQKDPEFFSYEHSVAVYRLLEHFIQFPTEDIVGLMDRIDAEKKSA